MGDFAPYPQFFIAAGLCIQTANNDAIEKNFVFCVVRISYAFRAQTFFAESILGEIGLYIFINVNIR